MLIAIYTRWRIRFVHVHFVEQRLSTCKVLLETNHQCVLTFREKIQIGIINFSLGKAKSNSIMSSEVEETLKRLVSHTGVLGSIIINSDGVVRLFIIINITAWLLGLLFLRSVNKLPYNRPRETTTNFLFQFTHKKARSF